MVLGLFEGSMELQVNGGTFVPGQKITGTVSLKLNQPKKARELRLEFYGEVKRYRRGVNRIERVYEVRQQLGGEREYSNGEMFNFEIEVPAGISIPTPNFLSKLLVMVVPRPTFYVHASLDVSNELDINRRVRVEINGSMVNVQPISGTKKSEEALRLARQNMGAGREL